MTETGKTVVHVIDDDPSMRSALTRLLQAAGYSVNCYQSAGEFLVADPEDQAGAILIDLELGGPDGLALQGALNRRARALPVIFMSAFGDVTRAVQAMKAGAVDFLEKPFEAKALLTALQRALCTRNAVESPPMTQSVCLEDREQMVLQRVAIGRRTKQIAVELGLSERTIKSCRAELMKKLGATSFPQLILKAEHLRLI
ncbi:response regulator transcription factor [Paraburkholderia sp. Tr-20389]|uniref:response regulator transcription factor n=1 Tax=Paraburkholderia sp. Tr-20389 TaxID=2703903 RepID=UPI00197EC542|nr:response regulator [Paraburkholderia sp. Tr-20389]MBN3752306.1 response regulator transcription factor [Paraburkholderia sp. Tr-20389]